MAHCNVIYRHDASFSFALALMALPEPWRYRSCPVERRKTRTPVLERYLCSVYRAVAIDH